MSEGPRGALGQMWRIEIGSRRYALKEIFDEAPTERFIGEELDFVRRARALGIRTPARVPALDGRYLLTTPDGTWLRCYEWVDLSPIPRDAALPCRIGTLLARFHQCAVATAAEPYDGSPPDPWYDTVPSQHDWDVVARWNGSSAPRLLDVMSDVDLLGAYVTPTDPAATVLCHRDLHPENVFADADDNLEVVDWDDMGPAEPGRELARVLFDWFCDRTRTDLDAVRATITAYVDAGGTGRVADFSDFSMLLAGRLNFLLAQLQIATDPQREQRHRDWAAYEIDAHLTMLPTADQLAAVLEVCRSI